MLAAATPISPCGLHLHLRRQDLHNKLQAEGYTEAEIQRMLSEHDERESNYSRESAAQRVTREHKPLRPLLTSTRRRMQG